MLPLILVIALASTPANTKNLCVKLVECGKKPAVKACAVKAHKKVVKKVEGCCQAPVVNVYVEQHQSQVQSEAQAQAQYQHSYPSKGPSLILGVRGALGLWSCDPHVFGLVGLRLNAPNAHIGAEINTQFYWGHGVQFMVYPIEGGLLNWHLDLGVLWFYHYPFAAQDVHRRWDMTLGTGVELNILPFLAVTGDWRLAMPNPFDMNRMAWPDGNGKYLNTGNVVGNSFARSQFMVGLMLHTW